MPWFTNRPYTSFRGINAKDGNVRGADGTLYIRDSSVEIDSGKILNVDKSTVTATVGSGGGGGTLAATLNRQAGVVTLDGLLSSAASYSTLTLTNSLVSAQSAIIANLVNVAGTLATLTINSIAPAAGSVVFGLRNFGGTLNGTSYTLHYLVINK